MVQWREEKDEQGKEYKNVNPKKKVEKNDNEILLLLLLLLLMKTSLKMERYVHYVWT